jgi:hypothetical protein
LLFYVLNLKNYWKLKLQIFFQTFLKYNLKSSNMKLFTICLLFVLALVLTSCTATPAEPSSPGLGGMYYRAISGLGSDIGEPVTFTVGTDHIRCSTDPNGNVSINLDVEDDFIYRTGFVWDELQERWEEIYFEGETIGDSNWISNVAELDTQDDCLETLGSTDENSELFYVIYSCTELSPGNFDCHDNKWQMQIIEVLEDTTPAGQCIDNGNYLTFVNGPEEIIFEKSREVVVSSATSAVLDISGEMPGISGPITVSAGNVYDFDGLELRVTAINFVSVGSFENSIKVQITEISDLCDGNERVYWICDDSRHAGGFDDESESCQFGCSNGACNAASNLPNEPQAPGNETPITLTGLENVLEYVANDVQFVIGRAGSTQDYLVALDLSTHIEALNVVSGVVVTEGTDVTVTDENFNLANPDTNIIVIGSSCINEVTADLNNLQRGTCGEDSGLVPGRGQAQIYHLDNGKIALVIEGWDSTEIMATARALIRDSLAGNVCQLHGVTTPNEYERISCAGGGSSGEAPSS